MSIFNIFFSSLFIHFSKTLKLSTAFLFIVSQLPSQKDHKLSSWSVSSTSIDVKKKSLSRKNSFQSNNNKKSPSVTRNNSMKRRNRLPSTSGSFTSSSDSENEIERRTFEKQKRREKRSKDLPTQDKPKANVGGVINKASQGGSRARRTPTTGTLTNSQHVSPYKSNAKNISSPSSAHNKTISKNASRQLPSAPSSTPQPSIPKNNNQGITGKNIEVKASDSLRPESIERAGSRVSSLGSSSSVSSDADESEDVKTKKITSHEQSEDQLEFSNKDTIKKVFVMFTFH